MSLEKESLIEKIDRWGEEDRDEIDIHQSFLGSKDSMSPFEKGEMESWLKNKFREAKDEIDKETDPIKACKEACNLVNSLKKLGKSTSFMDDAISPPSCLDKR